MNKRTYLIFVCLVSTLGGFLFGYDTAVISGTLTFVRNQFALSALMEGWFVGSALLGCVLGVSVAGILSDKYGRKMILFLSALLFLISAVGCMIPANLIQLISFRLIGGLGVGIASMLSPLYIAEISLAEIRGRMIALYQFAITLGILISYFANAKILLLGQNASFTENSFWKWILTTEVWRGMFGAEALPAIAFLILIFFIPESPRWLMTRNREQQALLVLERVVSSDKAQKEIDEIKKVLKQETGTWRQLFSPGIRLALFIGVSLAVLSQFSGINAIIYYGPKIFEQGGFTTSSALNSQVIIGIVNVVFTLIAIWKIDSLGRRRLLLIGCFGMLIAHISIGIIFQSGQMDGIGLLILIPTFIAFFAFSYGPVVWTLLAEIYPTSVRGRAMSIATLSLWAANYIIGQMVPWSIEVLKPQGTFWLFAVMIIPAILVVWKLVPETKGKTLEEIEQYWL